MPSVCGLFFLRCDFVLQLQFDFGSDRDQWGVGICLTFGSDVDLGVWPWFRFVDSSFGILTLEVMMGFAFGCLVVNRIGLGC